jgi:hypothetical protein
MLPFGVTQIEQYRALQQNAAKLHLPHFPLATKLLSERKLTKSNRQISDCLSDRLSRRDFANVSAQNMGCLAQKKEAVLAKWAPTSNRFWVKNRSYTKQTTKPCLTGTRTHVRASLNSTKIAQVFATFESENTERPLWKLWNSRWNPLWNPLSNPLWKTTRFLQSDRPLLPGSDQNVENDVTQRKQRTQKFLPGATTTHSHLPKFRKVAQGSDELHN